MSNLLDELDAAINLLEQGRGHTVVSITMPQSMIDELKSQIPLSVYEVPSETDHPQYYAGRYRGVLIYASTDEHILKIEFADGPRMVIRRCLTQGSLLLPKGSL